MQEHTSRGNARRRLHRQGHMVTFRRRLYYRELSRNFGDVVVNFDVYANTAQICDLPPPPPQVTGTPFSITLTRNR